MVIGRLVCGHYVEYSSAWKTNMVSAREPCDICGTTEYVTQEWPEVWHSVCIEKGCGYRKSHGYAKVYAQKAADRHTAFTKHDVVLRWYSDAPEKPRPTSLPNRYQKPPQETAIPF